MILFGIPNYSIFLQRGLFVCVDDSFRAHSFRSHTHYAFSASSLRLAEKRLDNMHYAILVPHMLPACLPYYDLFKAQNIFILLLAIFCTVWQSKWITLKRKICQKHLHFFIIIESAHFQPKMPIKKHWANKLSFDLYFNAVFLLDCLLKISIGKKTVEII